MKISKTKNILRFIFIVIFVFDIILVGNRENNLYSNHPTQKIKQEQDYLKKAGFWIVEPFRIDEAELNPDIDYTWAEAVLEPWCSGSGTWLDPYIIENITINNGGINIMNSIEAYFIIRNSILNYIDFFWVKKGKLINNTVSGILLSSGYNNSIINNQIYNSTSVGIWSKSSGNNTISQNFIADSMWAIRVEGDVIVSNNTIIRCGGSPPHDDDNWAMLVYGDNNIIMNNTLLDSTYIGMEIYSGSDNIIKNNLIENSGGNAIDIYNAPLNTIEGNIFKNNSADGLHFEYHSNHNTAFNNIFLNNSQRGVYVWSTHCLFYNNSFIGNGENAFQRGYDGISWNYSGIGNYWDDYGGEDLDEDGIGDTPYYVNSLWTDTFDYYPIWDDGPDLIIENPKNNEVFRELPPNFTITYNYPDLDKIWYTLNDSTTRFIIESNGTIDSDAWSALDEGNVTIRFYANSTSNITKFKELYVIKDITNPDLFINQPENGLFGINAPPYNITVDDLSLNSVWYTLDGGINNFTITQFIGTIGQSVWSSLSDGYISIRFYANDKVGHINYDEVIVIKDTQTPVLIVLEPNSNQKYGDLSPTFNLIISDLHLDSYWYRINNQSTIFRMNSTQGTIDSSLWNSLMDGIHIITFYANDSIGNTAIVEITIEKVSDTPQQLIIYGFDLAIIIITLCFISIIFVFSKKHL